MLVQLSIRDIVLIDRLDLGFADGLTVLTGETGAGKSILLDSLGLTLGARARLSRPRRRAAARAMYPAPCSLRGHTSAMPLRCAASSTGPAMHDRT